MTGSRSGESHGGDLRIVWLGHSCFKLECGGNSIVIDPYQDMPGLPPLRTTANMVLCSHDHHDHNYIDAVEIKPPGGHWPFSIRTMDTYHDTTFGSQRGHNVVHIVECSQVRAAHFGDLGHLLSDDQVESVKPLHAAMIPVGGYYTIDAAEAKALCDLLEPRVIIPMHFKVEESQPINDLDQFLELVADRTIREYDTATVEVPADIEPHVAVLRPEKLWL